MQKSLELLLAGVVDYAGLFPPASLEMSAATEAYATYLRDPSSAMLGRFVLPVVRLREFEEAAENILPRGESTEPWRLSALPGPDLAADIDLALRFNCRHWPGSQIGHAVIDALEIRVSTADEILAAGSIMPHQFSPYFEIPIGADPADLVDAIRRGGGFAKARTGGITADAFPSASAVARFMLRCRDARVAFKLTAGLHHPLRAEYRLTYADDAPRGMMYGYLNVFVAAALAWNGAAEAVVTAALSCTNVADFEFTDSAIVFDGHAIPNAVIKDARANYIISFGSCSFREPVDELTSILGHAGLAAHSTS